MSNMVVQTNVLALNSHRNMKGVGTIQSKASQKLSSGYKINNAADDAAGLAISEKMRAQIRGLDMASKNAADAQSLINTAEGGMQEVDNMLQRMRELIDYASNDTNENNNVGSGDRQKIQDEIDQLTAEIDSMADRVEFNKKKVIDGTFSDPSELLAAATDKLNGVTQDLTSAVNAFNNAIAEQTKANADYTVAKGVMDGYNTAVNAQEVLVNSAIAALEGAAVAADGTPNGAGLSAALTDIRTDLVAKAKEDPRGLTQSYFEGLVEKYLMNVDQTTGQNENGDKVANTSGTAADNLSYTMGTAWGGTGAPAITLATDNASSSGTAATLGTAVASLQAIMAAAAKVAGEQGVLDRLSTAGAGVAINGSATTAGYFATPKAVTATAAGNVANANIVDLGTLTKTYSEFTETKLNADSAVAEKQKMVDRLNEKLGMYQAQIDAAKTQMSNLGTNTPGLYFQVGANADQGLQMSIGSVKTDLLGVGDGKGKSNINVIKDSGADITGYLDTLDEALSYVTTERSKLGAASNRLDYTMKSLDVSSENLSAAESRIRDTDMAKEMMNLTKSNVLQQASISMLAQANQAPQSLLSLLQ